MIASLQTALAFFYKSDLLPSCAAGRLTSHRPDCPAPIPELAIHFDAFGQTDNYFTSGAAAVIANQAGTPFRVVQPPA
jgi:hypothetical protein